MNTVFEILQNDDKNEGRGPYSTTNIYFSTKEEALKFVRSNYYANKYGVMGTPGGEYDIREKSMVFRIWTTVEEFLANSPEMKKAELLKRAHEIFTTEELKILGVK